MNRITKTVRGLLAGSVLAGLLLSGAVVAEGSASAATTPVLYSANNLPWSASRHPSRFVFGNGGSPYFTNLTWKSWGSGSAWGTGKVWTQKAGCSPSYKCAYTSRWVGVYLSVVKTRNGTRYYSKMSVELSVSGKLRWESGTYQSGWWGHFPNVWPWF